MDFILKPGAKRRVFAEVLAGPSQPLGAGWLAAL